MNVFGVSITTIIGNSDFIVSLILEFCGLVLSILCVVFFFIDKSLLIYLLGVFGILFIIAFVLFTLVSVQYKRLYDYLAIGFDFFVCVVVCAFMIANIKDDKIQTIVLSLAAAIYGGLLTLIGVAWTIKKSDRDRREDEMKKERPVFSYNMMKGEPKLGDIMPKMCFSDTLEDNKYKCDVFVEIENSNHSAFEIKRIHHDNKWVNMEGNRVVLPEAKCILNFRFTDNPECLFLEVEDLLRIKHYYQLKVLFFNAAISTRKIFHTVREINEIDEDTMNDMIKKEPKYE